MFTAQAYGDMQRTLWFQQGYLYSLAYTIIMFVFGWQAFRRWGSVARDPRYQKWRYLSLVSFQVGFFLIANVFAVQALSIQHAWRAWGLYQPWPLFFNTFHWYSQSDPRVVVYTFVGAGLFGTFVAIPLASWKHGKRFCTWVCGCGGLAETLGDRWRHLSPKGKRSRAWEFQGLVIFVAAAIVTLVTVGMFDTRANNGWALAYSYVVDFWLVAVIPIALYPFFGGKVWCRYWCPLAAYNGVLAKIYGRLRIVANTSCISCTLCSKYCQVGVDVMAFAKNQEGFDNANSACIQCGICIDVCPMNVLRFDSSPRRLFEEEMAKPEVCSCDAAYAAEARNKPGRALPVLNG
jgi:polyferredoxin